MATALVAQIIVDGKPYAGKVLDGVVSLIEDPKDPDRTRLEMNVKLQSWPSFDAPGPVRIIIVTEVGPRHVSTKEFTGHQLQVRRGEKYHSVLCYVPNVDHGDFVSI